VVAVEQQVKVCQLAQVAKREGQLTQRPVRLDRRTHRAADLVVATDNDRSNHRPSTQDV